MWSRNIPWGKAMARRYEFKPDKENSGIANKLILTRQQQKKLLKWVLYALVLLVLSVVQDVMLCQVRLFGVTTDLVPCGIFLICLTEGLEESCVFALIGAMLYHFSGASAGYHSIVLLTAISVGITYFRQSYLRKGFAAMMLCAALGMLLYVLLVFFVALFLGQTNFSRCWAFCLSGGLSMIAAPVLYPILGAIGKIGGESWKE